MKILAVVLLFPIALGLKHVCPGGTARCPDSSTCCELLDKSYGCCPLENAICCDDHIHCCPADTKCSAGMCYQSTNTSTSLYSIKSNDIVCPGGEATCPDETTCCKSPPGQIPKYGCCPMSGAVCCNDGFHCCPNGTTCDVEAGKCLGDGFVSEMYRKKTLRPQLPKNGLALIRASSQHATNVVCPSSELQCPDLTTCCKTQSGDWGCCPFPNAQCCVDKIHCCPENMHCDATSQYCSQGVMNTTSLRKVQAKEISQEVKDIVCPDKTQCDSKSTCCELPQGKFGCCPYVNATCCSDRLHCCPNRSQCDVKLRRCILHESWMSNVLHAIFHKL